VDGWIDGWMDVKGVLRIVYSIKKAANNYLIVLTIYCWSLLNDIE
jgi:hypothetical protein